MSNWEQDVVEMLTGCNIDGKGNPIEEEEVTYALGKFALSFLILVQWRPFENQQSPVYVVKWLFSRSNNMR